MEMLEINPADILISPPGMENVILVSPIYF